MSGTPRRLVWLTAVALWPAATDAQTIGPSFDDLIRIVRTDETVIVTETGGRKVSGVLTAVDESSLSLTKDGRTKTFARSEVAAVRLADGLGNGALLGAGVGLAGALGILAIVGSGDGYVLPSAKAGAPILLSGLGALVGVLVDRAHEGGKVLFLMPRQTPGFLGVSPLIGKDGVGVLLFFHR